MKLYFSVLILLGAVSSEASGQGSVLAAGRAYYTEGEFKKAVAHFRLALKVNPNDAESNYWMGMSYQALADIAFPFAGKYTSKARVYLTRATELAPGRLDYRRELFEFLLDSAGSSRAALRQAEDLLRTVPESDPDYSYMRQQFGEERRANASADARLGRLFLAIPRATYRLSELPVSALLSQRVAGPQTSAQGKGMSSAAGMPAEGSSVW
jgi:tetratricopeptide (TPR) repeat protein